VEDFSSEAFKAIGALEIFAAVGLIIPAVLEIADVLVPMAAVGLVLMMIGATVTHIRRDEAKQTAVNVFSRLAVFVAWGRLGPEPFF
jgi:uncharacterized membrane protein YphA (DoxX/SURF4 family)